MLNCSSVGVGVGVGVGAGVLDLLQDVKNKKKPRV
jgi:hypothetical protein